MKFSKLSKILIVVLLVSVLAISLIACSTSKNNKDEKQSIDSSSSTLMATEPNSADEASKLYNQLMEKENEILSTDKALWEKVFMASNKDTPMIEDGTNYGDFLLKTIEGAKDQFTDEEYKKLVAGAEQIKEIEGKLTILEQKYPECANAPSNGDSVPADSNGVISKGGGATSFPSFDGKDLDGNDIKSSDFFKSNNVTGICYSAEIACEGNIWQKDDTKCENIRCKAVPYQIAAGRWEKLQFHSYHSRSAATSLSDGGG